jgi:hypothetical protein
MMMMMTKMNLRDIVFFERLRLPAVLPGGLAAAETSFPSFFRFLKKKDVPIYDDNGQDC